MKKSFTAILLMMFTFNNAQTFKYGKVSIDELKATTCALDSTATAAILYNERYTHFEYDEEIGFYIVDEYFMRMKIYSIEGYDYATHSIPMYNSNSTKEEIIGLKGTTYTLENGEIVKTKLDNDAVFFEKTNKYWSQKKFTMPNLKVGAVLEWVYTLKSPFISKLDEVNLQSEIPIFINNVSIYVPEYLVYNTNTKGYLNIPIVNDNKGRTLDLSYMERVDYGSSIQSRRIQNSVSFNEKIYKINMTNVPALKDEPYAGNIENYAAGVLFELSLTRFPGSNIETYASDWEAVAKNIYESEYFGGELKEKSHFLADLPGVLEGKSTEAEKINAIFKHIKSKIKWNDFNGFYTDLGVKKAYKEGLGNVADINLNLISMLREAGFEANPVLISTVSNGIPYFPSRHAFNYVVASVHTTDGTVLLDASKPYTIPNILPESVLNFNGREIKSNGQSDWIKLYALKHSITKTVANFKFTDSGFEGNARKILNLSFALDYRNEMTALSKEKIIEKLNEEYENIDVLDVRINNLEDLEKEVNETIKFETESYFEEISGKTYIDPLFFYQITKNPFKSEQRDFPVFYNKPWVNSITINLTIPDHYTIESIPESKEIVLPDNLGVFAYKIVQNGQLILIESNIIINEPVIQATQYNIIKDFYRDIINKQAEKIVLSKK
jgi:hypothetical protein